jgi:peptidoglycan/xylan/chitin deacetylase (PgdA/CDA1 family)
MALSAENLERAGIPCAAGRLQPGANDAHSFWKPPESWRDVPGISIDASGAEAERYLYEKYLNEDERRPPATIRAYYRVKSLIPAGMRHRINSVAIRTRTRRRFPEWPCESALLDFWQRWLLDALATVGVSDEWHIAFWPRAMRCCIVLTHDVESPRGIDRMEKMADIEEKYGFRSAWNLPLAQYPIDWERVARLRRRGFEFGAHGLSHDGRLFRSDRDFAELKPLLEQLAHDRGLAGFRAPSTLRRAEWIARMDFDFDSSFSDTDPYEPQPGGTCSLFPFFLSRLVELPYTMPQDHTLIHLLRRSPLPVWALKARWIASIGGMILTLTHPDYSAGDACLPIYEELLKMLADIEQAWRAVPSQVARWWRRRTSMRLEVRGGEPSIEGPDTRDAALRRVSEEPLARWE